MGFRSYVVVSRALVVAIGLVAVCSSADAQFGGRRRGSAGSTEDGSGRQGRGQPQGEVTRLSANDQARLAITKAKVALNVTKAQEQAWQAYEDAATALLGTSAESARASTLSGRIEEQQAPLRSRLAAFDRLS